MKLTYLNQEKKLKTFGIVQVKLFSIEVQYMNRFYVFGIKRHF